MIQPIVREDLLYYLWTTKNFNHSELKTIHGKEVTIVNYGLRNDNSGPDFSDGQVLIDGMLWAGNIEMHVYSSDWDKHCHDLDAAYDNVILHVVYEFDKEIITSKERTIPTIELKGRIPRNILSGYARLISNNLWIPCENSFYKINQDQIYFWLQRLNIERIEEKSRRLKAILSENEFDWEESSYIYLARYMGSKVNRDPFEHLARILPKKLLVRNSYSVDNLEALLYGQAGMLQADFEDEYFKNLKNNYSFLKLKYKMQPMIPVSWKFSRMRPTGFPTIRISQFAQLIKNIGPIFSTIIEMEDTNDLKQLFQSQASDYWKTHYTFGKRTNSTSKKLSSSFIELLIMNVAIPLMYTYGSYIGNEMYVERALFHLENLSPEDNKIIRGYNKLGFKAKSAADSQALLQLKLNYCDKKHCLSCSIGNTLIKAK